jgi:hypothetical protein
VRDVAYRLAADVVVAVHFAYLVFIVIGAVLALRWPRLVPVHLAAVAVGLASITVGFDCPLTNLERWLRRLGGEQPYTNGFIDHYVKGHLYPHGYDRAVQLAIAAVVVGAYAVMWFRSRSRTTRLASHPS